MTSYIINNVPCYYMKADKLHRLKSDLKLKLFKLGMGSMSSLEHYLATIFLASLFQDRGKWYGHRSDASEFKLNQESL